MLEPIPLSLVQSGSELSEPRPLPAAPVVSWVERRGTKAAIVGRSLDGGPVREISHGPDPAPGRGFGGGCYTWLGHDAGLVYATRSGGLWMQPAGAAAGRSLTVDDRECRMPVADDVRADGTSEFVVYVVDEAEVLLTILATGETQRLDDGRHGFCFDPAVAPDGSSVSWTGWNPPDMPWDGSVRVDASLRDGSITVTALADAAIQQPRFAPDGVPTCVHDATGWLNVHVGDAAVVAEPVEHAGPTWGMGSRSYDLSPDGHRVAFARNEGGFGSLHVADRRTGSTERLGRGVHGQIVWMPEGIVALRSGATTPTQVVVYRPDDPTGPGSRGWSRWTAAIGPNASWPLAELPEPELVEIADEAAGVTMFARRYVAGDGRLLCWVHGGPTDQWQVEWRPRISYWVSRGWDVLVVDPRGTTGHGRRHQQGLHAGWGRVDVDDTAELIRHAHRSGWSTPEYTVVMGGSSGGLTVLGVMADHADLVAGGVASYPVSDLKALTEATHRFEAHYTDTLVAPLDGTAESERRFAELSPVSRAERIRGPLLITHGTDDPVVPIDQSRTLVDRIRRAGGTVEFVEYDGEGHGFKDPDNVADDYARTEAFLDRFV